MNVKSWDRKKWGKRGIYIKIKKKEKGKMLR